MFLTNASKGIYKGVPTLYFVFTSVYENMANPKSAIFHVFRLLRILAGFRSL